MVSGAMLHTAVQGPIHLPSCSCGLFLVLRILTIPSTDGERELGPMWVVCMGQIPIWCILLAHMALSRMLPWWPPLTIEQNVCELGKERGRPQLLANTHSLCYIIAVNTILSE